MVNTTIYLLPYVLITVVWLLALSFGYRIEKKPKDDYPELPSSANCYISALEQLKALKAKDSLAIVLYTQRGQWYDLSQALTMGLDMGRELTEMGIGLPDVALWEDGKRFRWVFEDEKSAFTFKMKFSSDIVDPPYEGFV